MEKQEIIDFIDTITQPAEYNQNSIMPSSQDQKNAEGFDYGWIEGIKCFKKMLKKKLKEDK